MENNKKTIAIVINTSWNIYNFRAGLLSALQKEGYRIVAIAPHDRYSNKLKKLGFEYHDIKINNKGTNPFEDLQLIWSFYRLYKKINPDILLHYTIKPNIYGTFAARLAGIPVISNISGLGTVFLNNNPSSKIARLLYKAALRTPSTVFFQNSHDRLLFTGQKLVSENKTDILPGSGIDVSKQPQIVGSATTAPFSFLFIARLVRDKGLIEFVDAARIVKKDYSEVEFNILGAFYPGNPTAVTEDEVAAWQKEGTINYLGTTDDVLSVIAQSDCVVLPSYREGLSRVLLEAAIMAKPIITTDVPGCREVVDDGINGLLCNLKDTQDLVKQLVKMLQYSPDQLSQMGVNGRKKIVNEFDEKIVTSKYTQAIKSCIGYS